MPRSLSKTIDVTDAGYTEKDAEAYDAIVQMVSYECLHYIAATQCGHEAWNKLHVIFGKTTAIERLNLEGQFYEKHYVGGPIRDYLREL